MSDFFQRLEAQRRVECANIAIGATLGVLAVTLAIKFAMEPSSLVDYIPALGATLPGACIAAGIIEYQGS